MPSRKKSKPNPPDPAMAASSSGRPSGAALAATARSPESRSEPNLAATGRSSQGQDSQDAGTGGSKEISSSQPDQKSTRISQSWYGGSPQPEAKAAKSTPEVNATRQSQGDGRTNSATSTPSKRASGLMPTAMTMRSQPMTATTKLNIGSPSSGKSAEVKEPEVQRKASEPSQLQGEPKDVAQAKAAPADTVMKDAAPPEAEKKAPTVDGKALEKPPADTTAPQNETSSKSKATESPQPAQGTWTSWFSRSQNKPPAATAEAEPSKQETTTSLEAAPDTKSKAKDVDKANDPPKQAAQAKALEQPTSQTGQKLAAAAVAVVDQVKAPIAAAVKDDSASTKSEPVPAKPQADKLKVQTDAKPPQPAEEEARPRSWLGLWTGSKANGIVPETAAKSPPTLEATPTAETAANAADGAAPGKKEEPVDARKDPPVAAQAAGSSSWAFWSRAPANTNNSNVGELAVAGSLSQSSPQRALDHEGGMPKALGSVQNRKRGRPDSLEVTEDGRTSSAPPPPKKPADAAPKESISAATSPRPTSKREIEVKNLLLPLFKETYPLEPEKATLLQQMMQLFYGKPVAMRHPTLIRDPPRIKRALAIGIHGYFPIPLVQSVIGRPTGTSIKFSEHAARAIHNYTQAHGYTPASVEKIALEGEGRIEERLDTLWKLLLNWIDKIRHADFILLACHSQGVPVAISLVAKLIGFGCVNGARIGICAMAGVNLGPFSDYRSRWIGGSAGELFEFARPDSAVSKGYQTALDTVLRFGGKVVYIGSMDDQLVSLQSSTFGSAQHPNIYRAVWVDGRVHVADFLTSLVGFALKLRNLGVSDHGLIRELSNPLAGSLVGGEGHSRLYEDPSVYDLAVEYTAGTTSPNSGPLKIDRSPTATSANPYILPFAMRGLLEEEFVRKELASEILELVKKFDDWKPTTKVLKDVKYRLEGVRSKL